MTLVVKEVPLAIDFDSSPRDGSPLAAHQRHYESTWQTLAPQHHFAKCVLGLPLISPTPSHCLSPILVMTFDGATVVVALAASR